MPSRIDEAGHTKAFDYPVAEHWGESRNVQFRRWDSNLPRAGRPPYLPNNHVLMDFVGGLADLPACTPCDNKLILS